MHNADSCGVLLSLQIPKKVHVLPNGKPRNECMMLMVVVSCCLFEYLGKCRTPPGFAYSNRLTKGSSFAVGQTVQYSCKPGYVFLDGKDYVTCQERDGRAQWTRITCQSKCEWKAI